MCAISVLALAASTLRLLLKAAKISIARYAAPRSPGGYPDFHLSRSVCRRIYYTARLPAIYSLFPERFKPFSPANSSGATFLLIC